jgi:hypothetical protein
MDLTQVKYLDGPDPFTFVIRWLGFSLQVKVHRHRPFSIGYGMLNCLWVNVNESINNCEKCFAWEILHVDVDDANESIDIGGKVCILPNIPSKPSMPMNMREICTMMTCAMTWQMMTW